MELKSKCNKLFSILIIMAMIVTMTPMSAFAAESAATSYSQVTSVSDVTAGGDFVLVAKHVQSTDPLTVKYYALGTTIGPKIVPTEVTVTDGVISGTDIPVWTLAASGDGVSLYNGAKYLGYGSSGTNFTQPGEAYEWDVAAQTEGFRFTASGASARAVAYGISQNKFGAYSTTNTADYVFDLLVFKAGSGEPVKVVAAPMGTPQAGAVEAGTEVALSTTTEGASIYYTLDESTPTTSSTLYTAPIAITSNTVIKAIAEKDGVSSAIQTLKYSIKTEKTIAEAKAAADGTEGITVKGTVIYISGKNVVVQDSTGGINLYFSGTPSGVAVGDVIKATGTRTTYNGLEQLKNVASFEKDGTAALPAQKVTIADILADQSTGALESTRIYIENAVIGAVNPSGNTTLTQDGSTINIYQCPQLEGVEEGDTVSLYAVVSDFKGYQLRVSKAEDIIGASGEEGITNGSYVIWAPEYNKALSSVYSGFNNTGVDVSETAGKLAGYGNTEIWTVEKNDDDTYYISYGGQRLAMSSNYSSMPLGEVNDKWVLEDAGNGLYYVKNVKRGCYIEWYASKNYWSGFAYINSGTEGMFALKFTPVTKGYETDAAVQETIAQWGGGGPYDAALNAQKVLGDKYVVGDMLDTNAQFTIKANGADGKPFMTSVTQTGGTNYYMGGENVGKNAETDYMQFAVNTAGYGDMSLSMRLRATKAAPGSLQLQYSTDNGVTFKNFTTGEYSYAYTSYVNGTPTPVAKDGTISDGIAKLSMAATYYINFTFDVPAGAENAENLLIRLKPGTERASGTGAVSGNIRVDSVALVGSPIKDSSITGYVTVSPDGEEDQAIGTELTMTSATEGAQISYRFVNTATGEGEWKTYSEEAKPVLEILPATLEVKASCEGKADSIVRTMTYAAGTVSRVKMSPNGGGVYIDGEETQVTLSCETEGAKIYYLIDDAESFTEYTQPIVLKKGFEKAVIQAYAVKEGFKDSNLVSRTFTERDSNTYGIYFGQLHSHTSYSDGAGTAAEAFAHAAQVPNLDFLAVTDHSNSFDNADVSTIADGSKSNEWTEGHELAKAATTEDFVGLFGYEMTWSNGLGHMNTFNTPGFQSRTQSQYSTYATALQNYYATLKTQPDSINQFNHPGTTFGDFSDFAHYDEEIDQLITIIEVGNGEGAIGSSGYFPSYEYYTRALDKGWHVAPTNNQDNHKGLWGDANTARSVVLADDLSEESIYDAMRNYRVYATEDNDLSIRYTLDDNLMGTILEKSDVGETVELEVVLNDPTDDVIGKVEVIVNGGLSIAQEQVDGNSDTVKFTVPSSYSYYYIRVTEQDGDIAVTAPVWVGKVEAVGISSFTTDAPLAVQGEELNLTLDLYNNENTALEIEEITFTIDDEVIHTADLETIKEVGKTSTASYSFAYTHDGIGKTEIYANVKAKLKGVEKVYKEVLKLTYVKPDMVTRVIVDGTHYNDYVSGYYGGNMNNFTSIAAESQVEVKVVKDAITAEMLDECSLLVISAPARNAGTANAGDYVAKPFEDSFIQMVADYVKAGGSVVVCGLADYQDSKVDKTLDNSADYHTAAQLNKLLAALGSTMTLNDDEAYDEVSNGGQAYRLYLENFNDESKWAEGIVEGQTYSQYSGCTVNPGSGQWIVRGFDTTYSIDSDKDGLGGIEKGEAVFLASEDTEFGGTIFAAGGVFLSDFEVKAELDNIWDLPYANRTIAENILEDVRVQLPLSTIAEMRQGNMGDVFRIQGYTTSSRIEGNAFFDAIYLQDDTAGVTVFPMGEDGLPVGVKMEVTGYVDAYQGDKEIQVMSYKILDEENHVYEPKKLSNKDAMDYDANGGSLIQVEGKVVEVEYGTDGSSVNQFVVRDGNGDLAKVFIDGYILSSKTGKNELASIVKEGNTVSAVGLLYMHPEGSSDESVAVLRVRDCEEIVLVAEGKTWESTLDKVNKEIAKVENTRFVVRSKLTVLDGKRAVKLSWTAPKVGLDGYEIYRSTKRYEGYGKKPFFKTTKTTYFNTRDLETGTRYYYKVRGYKNINGKVYYTQWSTKAWRTVK